MYNPDDKDLSPYSKAIEPAKPQPSGLMGEYAIMRRYLQDSKIMRERYGLGRQGSVETGVYYVRDIDVINAVDSRVRGLIRQFCEEMRAQGRFSATEPAPTPIRTVTP